MLSTQFETHSSAVSWALYLDTDGGLALDAGKLATEPQQQHKYEWLSWCALSRGHLIAPAAFAVTDDEWCDAMERSCAEAHYETASDPYDV